MSYKIGQIVKRGAEKFKVYKVEKYRAFAESEDKTTVICINRPWYLQIVK